MKFIHYSDEPIKRLDPLYYDIYPKEFYVMGKPTGLWFSAEDFKDDDQNWFTWCMGEKFRLDCLMCPHEITFKPEARILYLSSVSEILDFNEMYGYQMFPYQSTLEVDPKIQQMMKETLPFFVPPSESMDSIRWECVYEMWQGIVIAPYQWPLRLSSAARWYYGWDCASGCVWDIDAIKSFEYTPWKLIE